MAAAAAVLLGPAVQVEGVGRQARLAGLPAGVAETWGRR